MNMVRLILVFGLTLGFISRLSAQTQTPAPLPLDFAEAILRQWVQPEYPEVAKEAKLEGEVTVEFVVEANGKVSRAKVKKSTDERLNASALFAVQQWVFDPATAEGKSVASGMQVPVVFKLAQLHQKKPPLEPPATQKPEALPVTPAKLTTTPTPDYPEELENRKLPGRVLLEFSVEVDGTPSSPKVLWTPHAAFVGEALRALAKYRFEPAHQGPLPVKSNTTQGQLDFESLGVDRMELLTINQIRVLESEKYRQPPRPSVLPEPVYPRELLLAGEEGTATVSFTVTERGVVEDVLLKEASRPEFGAALIAAVEAWAFDAALVGNAPADAKLVVPYKFVPPATGAMNSLVLALRPGGAGVSGAGGLDERLRPVWRVSPVYPKALRIEKPAGKAVIEFIIDREGRARLPRVVSASHEEFGWAAAAAINQWVFARPLRGGQPVDVKVSIPFDFTSPKD